MSALEDIEKIINVWLQEATLEEAQFLAQDMSCGKMLRSKLILAIAGESDDSKKLAAIVELIQNASLLHDDVIDESTLRRGKPSMNATAGSKNAVMVGDLLYSKSFYELSKFDSRIAQVISHAVVRLSNGEILDVKLGESFNEKEYRYMQMIENKTASLIEACSEAAAILAGLDESIFRIYGRNLGIAFQIIDDILDITQDSTTLGKEALSDYKEGKCTLPYIYLYHDLPHEEAQRLKSYFKKPLQKEEQEWILTQLKNSGVIDRSFQVAKTLGYQALEAISCVNNVKLEQIMQSMIEREF